MFLFVHGVGLTSGRGRGDARNECGGCGVAQRALHTEMEAVHPLALPRSGAKLPQARSGVAASTKRGTWGKRCRCRHCAAVRTRCQRHRHQRSYCWQRYRCALSPPAVGSLRWASSRKDPAQAQGRLLFQYLCHPGGPSRPVLPRLVLLTPQVDALYTRKRRRGTVSTKKANCNKA
jgi:hypothetical protein